MPDNCVTINVTSRSSDWGRGLSPFYLGPVDMYHGIQAQNVENAWQYAKVYEDQVDKYEDPSKDYFIWAVKGFQSKEAHRYPRGKGAVPLYSYWDGKKYDYVTARKKLYVPLYASAVIKTLEWKLLKKEYSKINDKYGLALRDFDVYDSTDLTWKEMIENPNKKFGHGFVLAMMLENQDLLDQGIGVLQEIL